MSELANTLAQLRVPGHWKPDGLIPAKKSQRYRLGDSSKFFYGSSFHRTVPRVTHDAPLNPRVSHQPARGPRIPCGMKISAAHGGQKTPTPTRAPASPDRARRIGRVVCTVLQRTARGPAGRPEQARPPIGPSHVYGRRPGTPSQP